MKKLLLALFGFTIFLFAQTNMNMLLNEIEKNEDLSLKTKQESVGIVYVITRYQLDMMQAKTLADVLKNTIIGYNLNKYGLLDPWSVEGVPYGSNGIRVFIDNQEITSARYDNGLFLFSNIDLGFVDHIEIYYLTPSYKISTEPSYIIIRLYTKCPKRDEGKSLKFLTNAKSYSTSFNYASYPLFAHISHTHYDYDKSYENHSISRSNDNVHLLMTYRNRYGKMLLDAIYHNRDPFVGGLGINDYSGHLMFKNLHFGFDTSNKKNWKFSYTFNYLQDNHKFYENLFTMNKIEFKGYGFVNTLKVSKEIQQGKHNIIFGGMFRNKTTRYNNIEINNEKIDFDKMKDSNILGGFVEDNIKIQNNMIVGLGFERNHYFNDKMSDFDLNQYKLSFTFLPDNINVIKFAYQHLEYTYPPYYLIFANHDLKNQKNDVFIVKYKRKLQHNDSIEGVAFYGINKDYIISDNGTLDNLPYKVYMKFINITYKKTYNVINDFTINTIYLKMNNFSLKSYKKVVVLNTHRYKKFSFFEDVVYQNSKYEYHGTIDDHKFDVDLGGKYDYNDYLTLEAKIQNLFDNYDKAYYVYNPYTKSVNSITIPLQERTLYLGLELWF